MRRRVGKGAPAHTEPQSRSTARAPCPRVRPVFTLSTDTWARRHAIAFVASALRAGAFAHPTNGPIRAQARGEGVAPQCRPIPTVWCGMAGLAKIAIARYWRLLVVATAIVWPHGGAFAQAGAAAGRICRLQTIGTGRVSAISDGRSFLLDDGREIRLPAIEVPPAPHARETGARAQAGSAARAALEAILARESVELRQSRPATDRYGRTLAHAYVTRVGSQHSAAHEMVGSGFARVTAEGDD